MNSSEYYCYTVQYSTRIWDTPYKYSHGWPVLYKDAFMAWVWWVMLVICWHEEGHGHGGWAAGSWARLHKC